MPACHWTALSCPPRHRRRLRPKPVTDASGHRTFTFRGTKGSLRLLFRPIRIVDSPHHGGILPSQWVVVPIEIPILRTAAVGEIGERYAQQPRDSLIGGLPPRPHAHENRKCPAGMALNRHLCGASTLRFNCLPRCVYVPSCLYTFLF